MLPFLACVGGYGLITFRLVKENDSDGRKGFRFRLLWSIAISPKKMSLLSSVLQGDNRCESLDGYDSEGSDASSIQDLLCDLRSFIATDCQTPFFCITDENDVTFTLHSPSTPIFLEVRLYTAFSFNINLFGNLSFSVKRIDEKGLREATCNYERRARKSSGSLVIFTNLNLLLTRCGIEFLLRLLHASCNRHLFLAFSDR